MICLLLRLIFPRVILYKGNIEESSSTGEKGEENCHPDFSVDYREAKRSSNCLTVTQIFSASVCAWLSHLLCLRKAVSNSGEQEARSCLGTQEKLSPHFYESKAEMQACCGFI